ncbi:unnamed protein product [Ascophyllum nodosum]
MSRRRSSSRRGTASTAPASIAACAVLGLARLGGVMVHADDTLNVNVTDAFDFTGTQLEVLADEVLVEVGMFTSYTDTEGQWMTVKENGDYYDQTVWTSGMVAGMFWYQYAGTGDDAWKASGQFFLEGLEGVEETNDNDLGFQARYAYPFTLFSYTKHVFDSFGLGYKLISDDEDEDKEAYKERVLTGANTLNGFRWDADIPAFWSWTNLSNRPEWERAVNIDMMMNMEILLWANENGESEADSYATKVEAHANQTWIDVVRHGDNSTYHAADYDRATGELVEKGTYQGYDDSSTWTRGQAWGIYGNVMVYRFRQKPHFLSYSIGLLEYWEDNIPDDLVPPSDFDAPDDSRNGKDSSASAIVASALFELFTATGDALYLKRAQEYLFALMSPDANYYQPDATDGWQSILRRATSKWNDSETGAVFGDYFFLEALVRYQDLAPSILLWNETEVTVNAAESSQGGVTVSGARRLQVLSGGSFCRLSVSGDTVEFADRDCVPVPPDFDGVNAVQTPSPDLSSTMTPTSDGSGGGTFLTESDSPTAAPSASETSAPSSAEEIADDDGTSVGASNKIVFTGSDLVNDVAFALLDTAASVFFWLGVTLSNPWNIPSTVTLESDDGETAEGNVTTPEGGWKTGLNKVHFAIESLAMADGDWNKLETVTIEFVESGTSAGEEDTDVVVDWLVVTNELAL